MQAILVDDEPIMLRSFIRNSAGIAGLDIIAQFQDAVSAIAYAEKNTFELALLDVVLPKMNGVELAERLRELHPDLFIVFISAYNELPQRYTPHNDGYYYLTKPYNKVSIEAIMKKLLSNE